jgi:hypothetical protein
MATGNPTIDDFSAYLLQLTKPLNRKEKRLAYKHHERSSLTILKRRPLKVKLVDQSEDTEGGLE